MTISGFQHVNIRCAESDLPAIEKFYGEVLGLKAGPRPNFPFNGLWLYDGEDPIVHVSGRFPAGSIIVDNHTVSVHHIAFKATVAVEFRNRLKNVRGFFQRQNLPPTAYPSSLHAPARTNHQL